MNINSISRLQSGKWALHSSALPALRAAVEKISLADAIDYQYPDTDNIVFVGNVAVISIEGILLPNISELEALIGFTDTELVKAAIEECEANPIVDKVVLYINSPGGCTLALESTAEVIRSASKPVYAYTDSLCASAAYWIAAAATNGVYASSDAELGSVGVYCMTTSDYAFAQKQGYNPTFVRSGKYKAIGELPVSDDELAILQGECDEQWEIFKASVNANRSIADDDMQGLTFFGDKAKDKGYVDGFIPSISDLVSYLQN